MTYKVESVIAELSETLRTIAADAIGHAKDALAEDPKEVAEIAFGDTDCLAICVNGVGGKLDPKYPPLAVLVMDMMEWKPIKAFDEIGELIECYVPRTIKKGEGMVADPSLHPMDEHERQAVETAIASLQSGIDRLRAYEAERLKAQS